MKPKSSILCCIFVSQAFALDTSLVRGSGPLSPEEELKGFSLPPGFQAQLFAAEPQIDKPINIAFDERGRLWVTSTHEYPYAAVRERWSDAEGSRVADSRDAIIILEDTDKDGRADKRTVFADGLNIPTGVLPYKTGCIAWSIPNIWFFDDTDGDGICDKRTILFGPLGWEKDVHGNNSSFRLAPDGWIYATHGFSNTSHFKVRPENLNGAKPADPGTELTLNSGNVYRFLPDGSRIELFSAGQVNPFGLAWDDLGNLYSADCHSAPIYQLIPGAVYPSFGKPDDGLGFGPVMMHHSHSSTGICGITYLNSRTWGDDWQDRILIGNVVTSRINCDVVSFKGSTPIAREEQDFLSSADPWFRPVDLRIGPDRALYVADFYNKVIGHYEVPLEHPGRDRERGRIWRIVKNDGMPGEGSAAPDPVAQLRFAARSGPLAPEQLDTVRRWLGGKDPFEKRAAVEALIRPVSVDWLPDLLSAMALAPEEDESLRHQLRIVIRKHLELPDAFAKLPRGPMSSGLEAELLRIARSVQTEGAARYLLAELRSHPQPASELAASLNRLALLIPAGELADLAKEQFPLDFAAQADLLAAIVDGIQQRGDLPAADITGWASAIATKLLESQQPQSAAAWNAIADPASPAIPWAIQTRPLQDGGDLQVISSLDGGGPEPESRTGTLRSAAFSAPPAFTFVLCGHAGPLGEEAHTRTFVRLVDETTGEELRRAAPPRNDAATRIRWELGEHAGKKVRFELTDGDSGSAYAWLAAGGFEPALIDVASFSSGSGHAVRLSRLALLLKYAAPAGLRDRLAAYLPAPPPAPPSAITPEMRAAADQAIQSHSAAFNAAAADKPRGSELFTTHCAACHAIGGKGALVGPQLDGIGNRGPARLFEDILDPNRNVDAHFRLHLIARKDGSTFAGLERGRLGQVLVCVDAAGQEHRIPASDIISNEETGMSLMPPSFQALPAKDLQDLVAWLLEK
ncbi:c-type cytochrome [Luteolibacter sp. GHJ8]|uniref:C-type cytochrome n=1 Tax=Luteolibacter rhizosphaerae TaxID=2989719 RepID=A0ABT3G051_9BACT|nr:PVC-type heme-binding CxxCH protein [Luteolibacter rhizosphaerae]MCW1912605.1 c-type cytochrome [Luteolibacter rhizosphaerae]